MEAQILKIKEDLKKKLPNKYIAKSIEIQSLSRKFFDLATTLLPQLTYEQMFDQAVSILTFHKMHENNFNEPQKSHLANLLCNVCLPKISMLPSLEFEEDMILLKEYWGKDPGIGPVAMLGNKDITDKYYPKMNAYLKDYFWDIIFDTKDGDSPLKQRLFYRLKKYANRDKKKAVFILYYAKFPHSFHQYLIPYFKEFFAEQFLLEEFHLKTLGNLTFDDRESTQRILFENTKLDASFPFTISKLLKSQAIKQRKVQATIFCDLEGDESVYVSNSNHFPLLTKIVTTKGGALTEEMLMKLDSLNYKEISNHFDDKRNLKKFTNLITKGLDQDTQNDLFYLDVLLMQVCELLFYIEVPRWPGALIHNYIYFALVSEGILMQLTDLPMSLPGVMGKVVSSLRIKNNFVGWSYDYRNGHDMADSNIATQLSYNSLFPRIYFQGAELRLFLLWKKYVMKNSWELSVEERFIIQFWPALYGYFKDDDEESEEERNQRKLRKQAKLARKYPARRQEPIQVYQEKESQKKESQRNFKPEPVYKPGEQDHLVEIEEVPEPKPNDAIVIYRDIKAIIREAVLELPPFSQHSTLKNIGMVLDEQWGDAMRTYRDGSMERKKFLKLLGKALREILLLMAIPFLNEVTKKHQMSILFDEKNLVAGTKGFLNHY